MAKPNGIGIYSDGHSVALRITQSSRNVDQIWDAVQCAVDAGMTVEQFKREVAQAWADKLRQDAESANIELNRW